MQFTHTAGVDGTIIDMAGRFTFTDYQTFRGLLDLLKQTPGRIVLDLRKLDFLDSAALGMLLIAHEQAEHAGRDLMLREPRGQVRKTLKMASFETMFTIEQSAE